MCTFLFRVDVHSTFHHSSMLHHVPLLNFARDIQPRCCRGISHKYRNCNGIMQFKITLCAMLQLMMALRLDSTFRQDTRLDNAPTSHRINAPGSQWSSRRAGVMWSVSLVSNTKRAAEFWRSCSFLTWLTGMPNSKLLQSSNRDVTNVWINSLITVLSRILRIFLIFQIANDADLQTLLIWVVIIPDSSNMTPRLRTARQGAILALPNANQMER